MDMEVAAAGIQIGGLAIAAGTLFVALKSVRDQLWTATFSEYTKRYNEVMKDVPSIARRPGTPFRMSSLSALEQDDFLNAMRAYLNLCSEELYLHRAGRIDRKTWAIWLDGIERVVELPCVVESWPHLKVEYESVPGFCDMIEAIQKQTKPIGLAA